MIASALRPLGRRLVAAFALLALLAAPAAAGPYLVFDARTGEVLAENQAFDPWYPASLTKMMTIYVTLKAVAAGEITLDTPVVMTAHAAKEPPSKMGFKPGTAISVDTALKILVVKSANDVAMALGETVGGGEAGFVLQMNAAARQLGMVGTHFANPNGLPDPLQWTTARDYALLTRAIISEFPRTYDLFRITALSLGGKIIKTHNNLLVRYPGADGMKTGFICAGGFNVVASATRGGRRLVAVVFGERTAKIRDEKTAELLETAFDTGAGLFAKRTTVERLRPSEPPASAPADIRDMVCKRHPKSEESADGDADGAEANAALAPKSYLVPPFTTMDPVPISLLPPVRPATAAADPTAGAPLAGSIPPVPTPRPLVGAGAGADPAAPTLKRRKPQNG